MCSFIPRFGTRTPLFTIVECLLLQGSMMGLTTTTTNGEIHLLRFEPPLYEYVCGPIVHRSARNAHVLPYSSLKAVR